MSKDGKQVLYMANLYTRQLINRNLLIDPYVEIVLGKSLRITDNKNYVPKTLNPVFGR